MQATTTGTLDRPHTAGTILAIDDDPIALELFRRALAREGYHLETASNGAEGLKLARQVRPQAIILDVQMPGMDGWSVLDAIKNDAELAGTPVIMATMIDEKVKGFAHGAAHYLLKPIDRARLLSALKGCLTPSAPTNAEAPSEPVLAPPPAEVPAQKPKPPIRVLIVEDDKANRIVLERTLSKEGWSSWEAENGRDALASVARELPDLILLDLTMPELDGFGFLRELPALGASNVPVIAISARDLDNDERKLLTGVVRRVFLKGSYTRTELMREIRMHLAGRLGQAAP
jgi:CheY-like chemotaxis protein